MESIISEETVNQTVYRLPSVKARRIDDRWEMGCSASGFVQNLKDGVYEEPVSLLLSSYPNLPSRVAQAVINENYPFTVTEDDAVVIYWND